MPTETLCAHITHVLDLPFEKNSDLNHAVYSVFQFLTWEVTSVSSMVAQAIDLAGESKVHLLLFAGKTYHVHDAVMYRMPQYFRSNFKWHPDRDLFGPMFDKTHSECLIPMKHEEFGALVSWVYLQKFDVLLAANPDVGYWTRCSMTLVSPYLEEAIKKHGRGTCVSKHWRVIAIWCVVAVWMTLLSVDMIM